MRNHLCIWQVLILLGLGTITGCVTTSSLSPTSNETYHKPNEYLPIGFVSTINIVENFVVVNFSNSVMPRIGDELKVYRAGRPIGSVKITTPIRPPLATADILTGELQRGDAVRP